MEEREGVTKTIGSKSNAERKRQYEVTTSFTYTC